MRAIEQRSVFRGVNYDPEKDFRLHKQRLKSTKKSIDNDPPMNYDNRLSPRKQLAKQAAKESVYKENFLLAKRIFDIMEGDSDLSQHIGNTRHLDNHPGTMNFKRRFEEAQRIHANNMYLASRLQTIKASYKNADLCVVRPTKPKTAQQSTRKQKTKFMKELEHSLNILAQENGNEHNNLPQSQPQAHFKGYKFAGDGTSTYNNSNQLQSLFTEEDPTPDEKSSDDYLAAEYNDLHNTSPNENNGNKKIPKSRNILLEYTKIQNNCVLDVVVMKEPFRDRYIIFGKDVDVDQRYELRLNSEDVSNILDGDILVTSVDNVEVWMTLLNKVMLQPVKEFSKIAYTQEELDYIELNSRHSNAPSRPRSYANTGNNTANTTARSAPAANNRKISQGQTMEDIGFTDTMIPNAMIDQTTHNEAEEEEGEQQHKQKKENSMQMIPVVSLDLDGDEEYEPLYVDDFSPMNGQQNHRHNSLGSNSNNSNRNSQSNNNSNVLTLPIIITQGDDELIGYPPSPGETLAEDVYVGEEDVSVSGQQEGEGEAGGSRPMTRSSLPADPAEFSSPFPATTGSNNEIQRPTTAHSVAHHHSFGQVTVSTPPVATLPTDITSNSNNNSSKSNPMVMMKQPTPLVVIPPINLKAIQPVNNKPASTLNNVRTNQATQGNKKPVPPVFPASARTGAAVSSNTANLMVSQTARNGNKVNTPSAPNATAVNAGNKKIPAIPPKKPVQQLPSSQPVATTTCTTVAAASEAAAGMKPVPPPANKNSKAPSHKRIATNNTTANASSEVAAPTAAVSVEAAALAETESPPAIVITNSSNSDAKEMEKIFIIPPSLDSMDLAASAPTPKAITKGLSQEEHQPSPANLSTSQLLANGVVDGLESGTATPIIKPVAPGTSKAAHANTNASNATGNKMRGRPLRGSTFRPTPIDTTTDDNTETSAPTTGTGKTITPRRPGQPSPTSTSASASGSQAATPTVNNSKRPFAGHSKGSLRGSTASSYAPPVNSKASSISSNVGGSAVGGIAGAVDISAAIAAAVAAVGVVENEAEAQNLPQQQEKLPQEEKEQEEGEVKQSVEPLQPAPEKEAVAVVSVAITAEERSKILKAMVESVVTDALHEAIMHCSLPASATQMVTAEQYLATLGLNSASNDSLDESALYDDLLHGSITTNNTYNTTDTKSTAAKPVDETTVRSTSFNSHVQSQSQSLPDEYEADFDETVASSTSPSLTLPQPQYQPQVHPNQQSADEVAVVEGEFEESYANESDEEETNPYEQSGFEAVEED